MAQYYRFNIAEVRLAGQRGRAVTLRWPDAPAPQTPEARHERVAVLEQLADLWADGSGFVLSHPQARECICLVARAADYGASGEWLLVPCILPGPADVLPLQTVLDTRNRVDAYWVRGRAATIERAMELGYSEVLGLVTREFVQWRHTLRHGDAATAGVTQADALTRRARAVPSTSTVGRRKAAARA